MADIYATISWVSYVLAGITFMAALIIFFALNVRENYVELRGQTDKQWVVRQQRKPRKTTERKTFAAKEQPTETRTQEPRVNDTVDGEAATVLETGEVVTELGLIGVYEPGTDVVTEVFDGTFRIIKKEIRLYSNEIVT